MTVEYKSTYSFTGRTVAPLVRLLVRPLLEYAPLHDQLLRRMHLVDLAGFALPLPKGARSTRYALDGFDAELVVGEGADPNSDSRVLYFHGGGFVVGGLRSHRRLVARISAASGMPVMHVGYRQLPHACLAQSVDDCFAAYLHLLKSGIPHSEITIAGDSAGGFLAFAVAQRAVDQGVPPAAIAVLSPWLDLGGEHSGAHHNAALDAVIPLRQMRKIAQKLNGPDGAITSVLDSDMSELPAVFVQVGSTEIMLSDAEILTSRLNAAGVESHLQIWQNQLHAFQLLADVMPEARDAIAEIGAFIRRNARRAGSRPQISRPAKEERRYARVK